MKDKIKIEALHDFGEAKLAQEWSDKFVPSPPRMALFEQIFTKIALQKQVKPNIVELGSGPGYLAQYILSRNDNCTYYSIDNSSHMLEMARDRLSGYSDRISFIHGDLTQNGWTADIGVVPDAVVTTWALHDLMSKENIERVYRNVYSLLGSNGIFLDGDFIKPDGTSHEYEAGRITIEEHITLLESAGFSNVSCLDKFEINVDAPTTSNNYACFFGIK